MTAAFTCEVCGEVHTTLPALGFADPHYYLTIPEAERGHRSDGNADWRSIDDEDHFIHGVLAIPVDDSADTLDLGLWVSVSEANLALYRDDNAEDAMAGWISNEIPGFDETLALVARVVPGAPGERPQLVLKPDDHPLVRLQNWGVTREDAAAVATVAAHDGAEGVASALRLLAEIGARLPAWPFADVGETRVVTLGRVIAGEEAVLAVSHDAEDGCWQFLSSVEPDENDATTESLRNALHRDPTLAELGDLPYGWHALRDAVGAPWQTAPNDEDEDEDEGEEDQDEADAD